MKTAKEMREIAEEQNMDAMLLEDVENVIEYTSKDGLMYLEYLVENKYNLSNVDWVVSELVANGYTVKQSKSAAYLIKLKISW